MPQAELARLYNVTRQTIRKWQDRDSPDDGSHCPTTLKTTLTPEQELIVIELRKTLLLPTDDLLVVTRSIQPSRALVWGAACVAMVSPACLNWPPGKPTSPVTKKSFKDYEPGFLPMDIKYLPQMPDETERRYLFVAIDRATR